MRIQTDAFSTSGRADSLLVLLPPALAQIEDFYAHGFVAAVRQRGIPIDMVLAQATQQQVMDNTFITALHTHVVQPAQAAGYRHIWLAGISIGAYNALYYAAEYAAHLAGIYLMAPYPGTRDILAEITDAGGARTWFDAHPTNMKEERAWWSWLASEALAGQWRTPVFFGTGSEDRFLGGQRLLADLLPTGRVLVCAGSHAWPTWQNLWHDWLDRGHLIR